MSSNERGLQNKADNNSRTSWEDSKFPILCEGCLGETPYVKMLVEHFASNCRMCDRPYTIFKWRPARSADYTRTQICQTCSKTKNLCQTCIRDMQLGIPSQLRDSVLSNAEDGGSVRIATIDQSDVNREYQTQQQMALINAGLNPYAPGDDPNERLLRLARSAKSDRQPINQKLQNLIAPVKKSTENIDFDEKKVTEDASDSTTELVIPEHIRSALTAEQPDSVVGQKRSLAAANTGEKTDLSKFKVADVVANNEQLTNFMKSANNISTVDNSSKEENLQKQMKKTKPLYAPRPPPGPPPPSAFVK